MATLDTSKAISPAESDAMTPAQWDAYWVTDWLAAESYNSPPPPSADPELDYAHENPDAWPLINLPSDMDGASAWLLLESAAELDEAVDERHLAGKHDQSTHGHGGKGKIDPNKQYGKADPQGNYPDYADHLDKTFDSYESIYAVPDTDKVPAVLLKYLPRGPVALDEGAIGDAQFDAATKQATKANSRRVRISASEARGNSRAVSEKEYDRIADDGERMLGTRMRNRAPAKGLDDNWDRVKEDSYGEVQKPWGGATINARTGKPLASNADEYALSIKTKGQDTVSISEKASRQEFDQAMDTARSRYRSQLEYEGSHLGVFHDDENARIDIDPVIVVKGLPEVEAIGAATHAIGGAYHFASGDGFWPPHVAADGGRMRKVGLGEEVHWFGPGDWHTYAEAVQKPIREQYLE